MTIRTRLWVSHLIALIVPIIMSLIILGIAFLGLVFYIERGNYIYVEHLNQYNYARQIVTNLTFKELSSGEKLSRANKLYHLFDPTSTYVKVTCDNKPITIYGNDALIKGIPKTILNNASSTNAFADDSNYYTSVKRNVNNKDYNMIFVSSSAVGVDDTNLNYFFKVTLGGIILFILISIWVVNKFLTRFTMRHILRPIESLTIAAKSIGNGNLDVHIEHNVDDEFKLITLRFNQMVHTLRKNKRQRLAEEQSRRELIAGISHDLRTPLTSIKAYVEGLTDGIALNDEQRQKYLNIIQKKTILMDQMLEQLFLFSKLDLGAVAVKSEPILLHDMIHDYVKDNREDYLNRGLVIQTDVKQTACILGDDSILIRILQNMLTNSAKYKDKEVGHSRICLSTSGNKAILTITDDGPGVPDDKLSRLFEVFYRTDQARTSSTEGSGLGLAIASKYIKLMGGTITATNVHPHGLQMTIIMPLIINRSN